MHDPAPAPREFDDTPIVFDARPKHVRICGTEDPPPPIVDLAQIEQDIARNRLDDLAAAVNSLDYGEMLALAAAIEVRPVVIHQWAKDRAIARSR